MISAIHLGDQADTDLALYDACQGTLIQESLDFGRDTHLSWVAPVNGMVYVRARHADSALFGPATAYAFSVRTVATGAAIIAGGRLNVFDSLQRQITFMTNHAYKVFSRPDAHDHIYYLSADPTSPSNVDGPSSPTNLAFAIRSWAPQHLTNGVPLCLLPGRSRRARTFFLETGQQRVTPAQLDRWLTVFQGQRPQSPVIVIIEACRSGSFITPPASLAQWAA
ncbi:MAG: hypothetical protein IPO15_22060 [Anaerolineae bacterium]|uniref:hypothetical protein n=1 Tax=Candidatus Amarolinea dominans TaxID=3140696 RepID=UPI0031373523|nr:hypothetical protein [Anaerolineae bacterium]